MAATNQCAKYTALTLMLLQNASFVLVMRYSRKQQENSAAAQYNIGIVVTLQEAFKLVLCVAVLSLEPGGSLHKGLAPMTRPRELLRIAVPAVCFTLQNNILYVALSNLDPLIFQVTYQIKTLLTALFSVALLGKTLTRVQWLSQCLLMAGIVLVQMGDSQAKPKVAAATAASADSAATPSPPTAAAASRNVLLGLVAVLVAAVSSAFASVYFERLLKEVSAPRKPPPQPVSPADRMADSPSSASPIGRGRENSRDRESGGGERGGGGKDDGIDDDGKPSGAKPTASLWERNVELSAWTVPINLLLAMASASTGQSGGLLALLSSPLSGFESSTWAIIVVNGIGGLLVAAVIKYADNIWKGFATAGAIVLTGLLAPLLDLGPSPSVLLLGGASLVIGSIMLYALPPTSAMARSWPMKVHRQVSE